MTHDEQVSMYMKLTKEELVELVIHGREILLRLAYPLYSVGGRLSQIAGELGQQARRRGDRSKRCSRCHKSFRYGHGTGKRETAMFCTPKCQKAQAYAEEKNRAAFGVGLTRQAGE